MRNPLVLARGKFYRVSLWSLCKSQEQRTMKQKENAKFAYG